MTLLIENASATPHVLSRREVMIGAAGLSFAITLGAHKRATAAVLAAERVGKTMSPWVSIAPDGTITIMSAGTEMGQGSMTSLPLIIAEELDADWSKVAIVPAPAIEAIYGNPGFQGMMYTAGSNAVTSYYMPLRTFGAQVRKVLLDNAAHKWGVPVEELTTEPSVVVHAKSSRRLPYGEVAAFADIPEKAPEIKPDATQEPEKFPTDRQRRDAGGPAWKGQWHAPAMPSTCRFRTCSTRPCCGRRWKARCRTRSTMRKPRRCPAGFALCACPGVSLRWPKQHGRHSARGRRCSIGDLDQDRHRLGL